MTTPPETALRSFLERHPWTDALRAGGTPLEWFWIYELEAPLDDLWRLLIDSSRLNRALGLGRMDFVEQDGALHGATINGGFRQEWVEVPWTWVAGRTMTSVRIYSRGFARTVRAIYELEAIDDAHVRLLVYFGWVPRSAFGRVMLSLGEGFMRRNYARVIVELARHARDSRPVIFTLPPPSLSDEARAKIEATVAELRARGLDEAVIDRLAEHVRSADELDLYRLQVRALARTWGQSERELLHVCLHATRLGLLEMSWDVVCPHCRGVREEHGALSKIPNGGRCDACDLEFGTGDENSIEITFHVHPSIRDIPKQHFCSAEPATKSHIKLQLRLDPGESREVAPRLAPGRYRARLRGEGEIQRCDVDAQADVDEAPTWRASVGLSRDRLVAHPTIRLVNDRDEAETFILEEARWSDDALRPAHLLGSREFRDLFSEQFLGVDVQLAVGEQVILFTDMVGSTRFYSERGDAGAFAEVRAHFAEITEILDAEGGVLIKTIGDATMAAFPTPLPALRAALAIQRRFAPAREDTTIRLRISIHRGPCIAVNLNSAIDYFGGTVNIAAKLQACADAGQVALSEAIVDAPGAHELLAEVGATLVPTEYRSEAVGGALPVLRWDVWRAT
ncbi:MAG: DUF5939 domain-containing protein [Nannocystaceae bacterium]